MTTSLFKSIPPDAPLPELSTRQRLVHLGAWVVLVVATLAAVGIGLWHLRTQRNAESSARELAKQRAQESVTAVEAQLRHVEPLVTELARKLSAGELKSADLPAQLAAELTANPTAFELGAAYVPFMNDPSVRLYAPHASRHAGRVEAFALEQRYDYTQHTWYNDGLVKPTWGEPYFGGATQTFVVGYSAPFYRPNDPTKAVIGLVRENMTLERVQELISQVSVGQTGYGYLLSGKGTYIAHPNAEFVRRQRTAYDVAREANDEQRLRNLDRALLQREATEQEVISGVTGQASWLFNEPLTLNGWVLSTVAFKDEVAFDSRDTRRAILQVLGCALLALFAASMLIFSAHRAGHRALWRTALAAGALLLLGICSMWVLTLHFPDRNGEASVHIFDATALKKFLAGKLPHEQGQVEPLELAAGVSIRTLRFVSANDVVITGSLWERIPTARRAEVRPGVEMPDAEAVELHETASVTEGDTDVVSWNFKATLREPSEWSQKYPFDRALVRLRLAPKASSIPTVLVPDLTAYPLLTPSLLPGVDGDLVLPGWSLDHSYFSFLRQAGARSTTLVALQNTPLPYDLSFNVVAQRRFLDPFISSVLPTIVIMCLLFGLLVVGSKVPSKVSATGFKATDILRASVGLLFPALIAQVNLRSKLGATEIIYIEYFYFILYAAILGVAANAIAFTLSGSGMTQVRDNLIPKLLFWPVVLGACFSVTLAFLY